MGHIIIQGLLGGLNDMLVRPEIRVPNLKMKDPVTGPLHVLDLGQQLKHRLANQSVTNPGQSPHTLSPAPKTNCRAVLYLTAVNKYSVTKNLIIHKHNCN